MKRAIALLLAVIMSTMLFSACGSSNNSGVSNEDSKQTNNTASNKEVTLKMATMQVREKDLIDQFMSEWQAKNSNIKVDIQYIPNEQYLNVVKAKFATNDGPDLLALWGPADFVKANYLMDISDFPSVKRQTKGVDLYKVDGKVYGLAMGQAALGMIANNTVLKKAGVTSLPKNFPELLAACEKIKAIGIDPIAYGDKDATSSELHGGWAGETLMTEEEGKGIVAGTFKPSQSKGIRNAFENTKTLFDKGYLMKNFQGLTLDQAIAAFAQGKAAFIIGAQWTFSSITTANKDCDFSLFPIPYAQEGQSRAMAYVNYGFCVNAETKEKDAVMKLFDGFASQDYAKYMGKDFTIPIDGVICDTAKQDVEFNKAYGQYLSPTYFQVYNWIDPAGISRRNMQDYLAGKKLDDVLAAYDADVAKTVQK